MASLSMAPLNLPVASLSIRQRGDKTLVFDRFRKRFVILTPEEWVRQHFLWWLCEEKGYPEGRISVEASLRYNNMARRADAIIFGGSGDPLMIIECKSATVRITQDVFDQVARYNAPFGVSYLVVTNGLVHYCCWRNGREEQWYFLKEVPPYADILDPNIQ